MRTGGQENNGEIKLTNKKQRRDRALSLPSNHNSCHFHSMRDESLTVKTTRSAGPQGEITLVSPGLLMTCSPEEGLGWAESGSWGIPGVSGWHVLSTWELQSPAPLSLKVFRTIMCEQFARDDGVSS